MKRSFLLALTVSGVLSFNALAEVPSCGENCTYTLTENGIDAKGNKTYAITLEPIDSLQPASVSDYSRYGFEKSETDTNYPPWRFENITEVKIKEGIKMIGNHAFVDMKTITSVELPEGLEKIGGSFNGTRITSLDLPSTITSIAAYAFSVAPIENINGLPDGIQSIGKYAFHNSKFTDLVIPASVTKLSAGAFGDGTTYNTALIENLYCEEAIIDQCEAALKWRKKIGATVSVIPYKKTADGQIFYNNKWYKSANDILSGDYAKKRIYTIDEANKITGKKNSVMIRYK